MLNTPITYSDLSFQAYQRIKEMILKGVLKPEEKIIQEKIAAHLGISRMPLHKAFQMLEDEYLVESIPRRGIFVRKHDLRDIIDAFECREGLEGVAARRATKNMSESQIMELEQIFLPFYDLHDVDMVEYQRADQVFHETLIQYSDNNILQRLNRIGNVLIRTFPKGLILPLEESMADHKKIISALQRRDAEQVEMLIRQHSRKARDILQNRLDSQNS